MKRGATLGLLVFGSSGLFGAAVVACVDGKTADCSLADSGCGPDLDGSFFEAGGDATDAPVADAPGSDGAQDATTDADASDGSDGDASVDGDAAHDGDAGDAKDG